MSNRQYAYMIKYGENLTTCIMYHLGRYCVGNVSKKEDKTITQILKQYKTLSGAERFLVKDFPHAERGAPNIFYADEAFIKKGEYWR